MRTYIIYNKVEIPLTVYSPHTSLPRWHNPEFVASVRQSLYGAHSEGWTTKMTLPDVCMYREDYLNLSDRREVADVTHEKPAVFPGPSSSRHEGALQGATFCLASRRYSRVAYPLNRVFSGSALHNMTVSLIRIIEYGRK